MNVRLTAVLLAVGFGLVLSAARAEELKSGPSDKAGGPFDVRAITGEHRKGDTKEQLCYFCQYNAQQRPAVVMIFTQKADEDLASLVKAVDTVQKSNKDLGTVVVGVSGVTDADMEKLQETHKLTTPLTIAVDKDGPAAYDLNKEAAVTVLVYKKGGKVVKNFAFKDTKSAAAKAKDITETAQDALK
jgi:peroxiredoxin